MIRLLAVLGLLASASASAEPVGVPLKDAVPHMTTTGEASVDVVPDLAEVALAVSQESASADEAAANTAKAATAVVDAVEGHGGVEAADIRTNFALSETFVETNNEHGVATSRVHRGYSASERVVVTLRDLAKVGPLVRDLIDKGATSFEGVTFIYSKEKVRRRELQVQAIRDAYQAARGYAEAIGLKLGRVLQVGEDPAGYSGVNADMPTRRAPSREAAIPTQPGVLHLSETISVIWEIEGAAR